MESCKDKNNHIGRNSSLAARARSKWYLYYELSRPAETRQFREDKNERDIFGSLQIIRSAQCLAGKGVSDGTASETCVRFLQMALFKSGAEKVDRPFLFAIIEDHEPKMDKLQFVRLRLRIHVTNITSNLEVPNSKDQI
jgi:hypothetical protein